MAAVQASIVFKEDAFLSQNSFEFEEALQTGREKEEEINVSGSIEINTFGYETNWGFKKATGGGVILYVQNQLKKQLNVVGIEDSTISVLIEFQNYRVDIATALTQTGKESLDKYLSSGSQIELNTD